MATTPVEEVPKVLKCQTWVLKVPIHCQGCKRKVEKVLRGIHGVYTTTIDSQQQRVTVTGDVEGETLIKKLLKSGKHAKLWPGEVAAKEKERALKNQKDLKNATGQGYTVNGSKKAAQVVEKKQSEEMKNGSTSSEKSTAGEELPEMQSQGKDMGNEGEGGAKSGGKKKKEKGEKRSNKGNGGKESGSPSSGTAAGTGFQNHGLTMDQVVGPCNLNPTRQCWSPCSQGFPVSPMWASDYDMPSWPLTYRQVHTHPETLSFFSDDNVNGCSIL